jgi:subtilisin
MNFENEPIHMLPPHTPFAGVNILAERLDYAHEMMNVPYMWKDTRGEGVKVVVIDTGLPRHVDLNPAGGRSVIDGYLDDEEGHSTHVGGIIAAIANNSIGVAGIAPECDDWYIAALDRTGVGTLAGIARAIRIAVDELGADVINLSLGAANVPLSRVLEQACNHAVLQGAVLIAASGNDGGPISQPAIYDSVISVGAIDERRRHAQFSNIGRNLDFVAPGVQVYSTYLNNRYVRMDGTSMACPMLAGIAALIIASHRLKGERLSPFDVKAHIRDIAFDIGPEGHDEKHGHGVPVFAAPATPPPDAVKRPGRDRVKAKSVPQGDCVYWRVFNRILDSLSPEDPTDITVAKVVSGLRRERDAVAKLVDTM